MKGHAGAPLTSFEAELDAKPILALDFRIVWWLYDLKTVYPNATAVIHTLVSRYRTQDISILLWVFFLYVVSDLGIPYFYTCVCNLVAATALQYAISAKRPIDYDDSLFEHARTDPDTTGFPSIDSHMAIVVIGPAVTSDAVSASTAALMVASGLIIAFTRVFVGVRFPSQIVGSWGTGLMGVLVANFVHVSVLHHASTSALPASFHRVIVVCVVVGALFCVASWVEASDSRNFGIPRHEFTRVMASIVTGGTDEVAVAPSAIPATDDSRRRDSFYYLIKSVHSRRRRPETTAGPLRPPRVTFSATKGDQQRPIKTPL